MTTVIDEIVADAGVSDDEAADLSAFLSDLERLADIPPPAPSDELAALLAAPRVVDPRRPRLRLVAAAGAVAAVSAVSVTGVAAAANELPTPAQEFVADLSERYLPQPFRFPQPVLSPVPKGEPAEKQRPRTEQDEPELRVPAPQPTFPVPDEGLSTSVPQQPTAGTNEPSASSTPDQTPAGTPSPAPSPPPTNPSSTASPVPTPSPEPTGTPSPTGSAGASPTSDPRVGESPTPTGDPEAGTEPTPTSGPPKV